QKAILDYAAQLLSVQAEREIHKAYSHPPDTKWQLEFENSFIYTETADQLTAIEDSKRDMEKPQPMDRLICGDVGFGKTEVAIRTAFKAVMGGRQVAMLAPTTVLAQQHFNTLRERMSDYPVSIDLLSRYRTAKQQRETVKKIRQGEVDIVIGTHRLISKDIEFKELGLVIIDEEQRFGVKHKERFKQMFRLVDILTLSATPIPRTLYLSLMGARDMSTIETPPPNRYPVETSICAYDEGVIRKALKRELDRRGQVFFLHNRVGTIEKTKQLIEELAPGARVGIGHGQMEEGVLEQVMRRFIDGDIDVLVCTTIIESGVDIPNANTIIIDRADRFGLADLYQLRGRVGRAGHKAYAILMLPPDLLTTGDAKKRISAIRQYSSLGAGFKIAMRDLEIRGAGNLLGTQQSGHILAIGFEMYCKLLKGSISSLTGKPGADRIDVALRIDFLCISEAEFLQTHGKLPAFIPASFLPEPGMRIDAYKMLAELDTMKEFKALIHTWRDRFGKSFPKPVDNLLRCTELKLAAARSNISSVEILEGKLMLTRNGDYVLINGRFPRLDGKNHEDALLNAVDMVKKF
ncbi:MAG: DEAD/DEAH box helicase, partial [Verrucomicrobiales bacterium]